MNLDALKSLLEDFDLSKVLPSLDTITGWMELAARIIVVAGPLTLLGFGLLYLLSPPKEANYSLGFRCWWGMASLESWQFTQKVAGIGWSIAGLILTLVMALKATGFREMEVMDMLASTIPCLLWELGTVLVLNLIINIIVIIFFDHSGFRRDFHNK